MTDTEEKLLIAAALGVGVIWLVRQFPNAVSATADALNPANPDNIINQGATAAYQGVTGSTGTIGGDIYDATHPVLLVNDPYSASYDPSKPRTLPDGTPYGIWDTLKWDFHRMWN